MISLKELNPHGYSTTEEQDTNLNTLLTRLNSVRALWNRPMVITSGLRSDADQARINPNAPKSKHLIGAAADIKDDGSLYKWLHDHPDVMSIADLYGEIGTKGWVHLQCLPFGSYTPGHSRWFYP